MAEGVARAVLSAGLWLVVGACATVTPHGHDTPNATTADRPPSTYALNLGVVNAEGQPAPLSTFEGKLLVLVVATPGCAACEALKPRLSGLARALQAEGAEVVYAALWLEGPPPDAESEGLWAGPTLSEGASRLGRIDTVPLTWILSREGTPLFRYEGGGESVVAHVERDLRGYLRVENRF